MKNIKFNNTDKKIYVCIQQFWQQDKLILAIEETQRAAPQNPPLVFAPSPPKPHVNVGSEWSS